MTKIARVPGAAIQQFQHSRETMATATRSDETKRAAQQVVCQYVDAWYSDLDETGKVAEANELFDILGIKGR